MSVNDGADCQVLELNHGFIVMVNWILNDKSLGK
jgi:hypothetical protein